MKNDLRLLNLAMKTCRNQSFYMGLITRHLDMLLGI